jgi:hypothetical protein
MPRQDGDVDAALGEGNPRRRRLSAFLGLDRLDPRDQTMPISGHGTVHWVLGSKAEESSEDGNSLVLALFFT